MKQFNVLPEFKSQVADILSKKKFSSVFQYMNLVNRDGNLYAESELNSIVQLLGEFSYSEVADFFGRLPDMVSEVTPEKVSTESETENVKAIDSKKQK